MGIEHLKWGLRPFLRRVSLGAVSTRVSLSTISDGGGGDLKK